MPRGRFIIVEGIDGSGKSTQVENVANVLRVRGREVLETMSPSQWYRDIPEVRAFISVGKCALSADRLASLAAADRMRMIKAELVPALNDDVDVICDRYIYSAFGYSLMRGANMDFVERVNSRVLEPSHGVLLGLTPEDALKRIHIRGVRSTYEEDPEYLSSVQAEMDRRWPKNFLKLDATLDADEITVRISNYVNSPLAHL